MELEKKPFGEGASGAESSAETGKMMSAAAGILAQRHQGRPAFAQVKDREGKVCGFWLADAHRAEDEAFLKMLAVAEELNEDTFISICLKDYRVVPNYYDDAGGCFLMIGSALAPGEEVPTLDSFRWTKGAPNPASTLVDQRHDLSVVRFACPTCR